MRSEWLDVVRVQDKANAEARVIACATVSAGVIVALEHGFAPVAVLNLVAGYAVLVGLVFVIGKACFSGSLAVLTGSWMCQLIARLRAEAAKQAALAVLGHGLAALRAWHFNGKASAADLILLGNIRLPLLADLAPTSDKNSLAHRSTLSHKANYGNVLERLHGLGLTPELLA